MMEKRTILIIMVVWVVLFVSYTGYTYINAPMVCVESLGPDGPIEEVRGGCHLVYLWPILGMIVGLLVLIGLIVWYRKS
jgi:hypothetical protein